MTTPSSPVLGSRPGPRPGYAPDLGSRPGPRPDKPGYAPDPYVSTAPFDAAHPRALAIYCSDGRFTQSVEDLLHHLGHDRLDTLTMPGGPGLLNLWAGSLLEAHQVEHAARFLIQGHSIDHAVLLAHAGCGYYRQRYPGRSAEGVKASQIEDLRVAARAIRAARRGITVALYYTSPEGGRVRFDPVIEEAKVP